MTDQVLPANDINELRALACAFVFFGWMVIHPRSLLAIFFLGRPVTPGQVSLLRVIAGISLVGIALSLFVWLVVPR